VLAQVNQSDLAFLRERARAVNAELWMEGATLHAKSRTSRSSGALQMTYGENLHEFSVLADLAGQCTGMVVSGWDVAGKQALSHEANDSVVGSELHGGVSGASVLSSTFGDRKEAVVHTVPLTSQEAQAEAEALFRMTARRFVVGRGVGDVDPRLRVGASVDLKELGPLFDGKYYLSEIKHLFDGLRGIRTQFTAERPGLGQV
jgi:phage protein D